MTSDRIFPMILRHLETYLDAEETEELIGGVADEHLRRDLRLYRRDLRILSGQFSEKDLIALEQISASRFAEIVALTSDFVAELEERDAVRVGLAMTRLAGVLIQAAELVDTRVPSTVFRATTTQTLPPSAPDQTASKPEDRLREPRELLFEWLKEEGVELPSIPESPGRRAYLRFLQAMGYREEELLPIVESERLMDEAPHTFPLLAIAMGKVQDPDQLRLIASVVYNCLGGGDNTNLLISLLAEALEREFGPDATPLPEFYAGVFPTDSFNAQCRVFEGHPLVLIDTGCMETTEAIVISFLSKLSPTATASEWADAVDRYVSTGRRADPYAATSHSIDWGDAVVADMVSATEKYVLAHEIGHLVLGHVREDRLRQHLPRVGAQLEVADKAEFDEFQADLWACRALIDGAKQNIENTESEECLAKARLAVTLAGPVIALGVGLMVEAARIAQGLAMTDGHPPAVERLYMVETLYELLGVDKYAFVWRRFAEVLDHTVKVRYPNATLPPLLDARLNRKLIPVLDSLGIGHGDAEYITGIT